MTPSKTSSLITDNNNKNSTAFQKGLKCSSSVTFQDLLDKIRTIFNQPDKKVDVDELWRVLESYKSNPDDWKKYAYYDMNRYKRNLVDEDENYNIMILGWGPNVKSCIHDHAGSHCFMKTLDGDLIESRFAWPKVTNENDSENTQIEHEMSGLSDNKIAQNQVAYINDKVGLHRVENPNPYKTSTSLHVYIPPLKQCKAFDQRTGSARECELTFYSKCGKITQEDGEDARQKGKLSKGLAEC